MAPCRLLTVRAVVIAAVKVETMISAANIHTTATSRPPSVTGDLSP